MFYTTKLRQSRASAVQRGERKKKAPTCPTEVSCSSACSRTRGSPLSGPVRFLASAATLSERGEKRGRGSRAASGRKRGGPVGRKSQPRSGHAKIAGRKPRGEIFRDRRTHTLPIKEGLLRFPPRGTRAAFTASSQPPRRVGAHRSVSRYSRAPPKRRRLLAVGSRLDGLRRPERHFSLLLARPQECAPSLLLQPDLLGGELLLPAVLWRPTPQRRRRRPSSPAAQWSSVHC